MKFRYLTAIAVMTAMAVFTAASAYSATVKKQEQQLTAKKGAAAKASPKNVPRPEKRSTANRIAKRQGTKANGKSGGAVAQTQKIGKNALEVKRQETQNKIEAVRTSISENNTRKKKLEEELRLSEQEIHKVRNNLRSLRRDRMQSERKLRVQERTVIGLQNELTHEQQILEEINRQRLELLTQQQQPQWTSSDPNQKARANMMLGLLAKKSSESIRRLEKSQKELNAAVNRSKITSDKLNKTLAEERTEQTRLTRERRERQLTADKLDKELASQTVTLKKLQNDEKRLGNLMASLQKKEAAERRVREPQSKGRKTAGTSVAAAEPTGVTRTSQPINPVSGKVVAKFGEKRTVQGKTDRWQGTVFSVNGDEGVHAVRSGKVVFADYLRGYGNLIVLDHGGGYYSVYGNNATLEKDIGDQVKAGETISRVGKKEGAVSVLYFEVRHNGKPIDPTPWLNI